MSARAIRSLWLGGRRRRFRCDTAKVDSRPGCGFIQVKDEALPAVFDEGPERSGFESLFQDFMKGVVSVPVELAFATSHGFELLLEALEVCEGDAKGGVPPVHKCPSTGVGWVIKGDLDMHVGMAPGGDVGDNHLLGRAPLLLEKVDVVDPPVAVLVRALNGKPVAIHEEKPGRGWPARRGWLGVEG